jgi:hypothetical protein
VWQAYKFFSDLFSSHDKPHIVRPSKAAHDNRRRGDIKNEGRENLENVSVYADNGYLQRGLGLVEGDKIDLNLPPLIWNEPWWIEAESSEPPRRPPANAEQVKRKIACTADVLLTAFVSAAVPGAALAKVVTGYLDVNINPVQWALGYTPLLSSAPTIPSVAAGTSSAIWLYRNEVFKQAGGQGALDRLQGLASRTFSGAENAAKYGSKIAELQRLSTAVSVAARVTGVFSAVSAGYDVYMCLGGGN